MDGIDRHGIGQRAPQPLHVGLTHRYRQEYDEQERGNEDMRQRGKGAAGHGPPH